MKKLGKEFSEVEHWDDARRIDAAIEKAGGNVIHRNADYENETYAVIVETEDPVGFWDKVELIMEEE